MGGLLGKMGWNVACATPSRRDPGLISGAFVAAAASTGTAYRRQEGPHQERRGPVESRIQRASAGIRRRGGRELDGWGMAQRRKRPV